MGSFQICAQHDKPIHRTLRRRPGGLRVDYDPLSAVTRCPNAEPRTQEAVAAPGGIETPEKLQQWIFRRHEIAEFELEVGHRSPEFRGRIVYDHALAREAKTSGAIARRSYWPFVGKCVTKRSNALTDFQLGIDTALRLMNDDIMLPRACADAYAEITNAESEGSLSSAIR